MKKILKIKLKENRPNLLDDFSNFLKSQPIDVYENYWNCFDILFDEDLLSFTHSDEDDDFFKPRDKKRKKRKKKNREWGVYDEGEFERDYDENDDDDNEYKLSEQEIDEILDKKKEILFYHDITLTNNVKKFKSIRKFFNFLDEEGIDISDAEGAKIIRADKSYCCVNPIKEQFDNHKEIISDHSYGALLYEVTDNISLLDE